MNDLRLVYRTNSEKFALALVKERVGHALGPQYIDCLCDDRRGKPSLFIPLFHQRPGMAFMILMHPWIPWTYLGWTRFLSNTLKSFEDLPVLFCFLNGEAEPILKICPPCLQRTTLKLDNSVATPQETLSPPYLWSFWSAELRGRRRNGYWLATEFRALCCPVENSICFGSNLHIL